MNQEIVNAIRSRKLIRFDYRGHDRVAEPHVYGSKSGIEQLLVYQVRGSSSSGGLPEWRRVDVPGMTSLTILDESFSGPRPYPSGRHSSWDVTYEIVR